MFINLDHFQVIFGHFVYVYFGHFRPISKKYVGRRGPKLECCAFANFGNSSGTEREPSQKTETTTGKKKKNQCCCDRESNPEPVELTK